MLQRGRKSSEHGPPSAAALAYDDRPPPPKDLTKSQAAEWVTIVDRMPAKWFTPETWPLLKQLCAHIVLSNIMRAELNKYGDEIAHDRMKTYEKLLKWMHRESSQIERLSRQLRITLASREKRSAATTAVLAATGHRPWTRRNGQNGATPEARS